MEQYKKPINYQVRDKKRPIVGAIMTALMVGAAAAYTVGYIFWALEGQSRKQPSEIERIIENGDF